MKTLSDAKDHFNELNFHYKHQQVIQFNEQTAFHIPIYFTNLSSLFWKQVQASTECTGKKFAEEWREKVGRFIQTIHPTETKVEIFIQSTSNLKVKYLSQWNQFICRNCKRDIKAFTLTANALLEGFLQQRNNQTLEDLRLNLGILKHEILHKIQECKRKG